MTPPLELVRRRLVGSFTVDEWGLDRDLVEATDDLLRLRFSVSVDELGPEIPQGPALLVTNRRFGWSEPIVVAQAVRRVWGRSARFAGIPDIAPFGPALRRLGGVLARPDEVAGLLRAGHTVLIGCDRMPRRPERAGAVPPALIAPAVELEVPVVPVAALGREWGRAWRVVLGLPLPPARAKSPLAVVEHAEAARAAVQELLDEQAPPRWPF